MPRDQADRYLQDLIAALGVDHVMMFHGYFDESGTHAGSPLTCVAGYLLQERQVRLLSRDWKDALEVAGVRRFHMVDCAHGTGEFKGKSRFERISLEKKLIGLIKKRATIGIVVSVRESDLLTIGGPASSAYVLCLTWCLNGVAAWIKKTRFSGKIAYFFEAGHDRQGLAHKAMCALQQNEILKTGCCYHSHVFIGKDDARPIQAADLLAWQWHTDWKNTYGSEHRPRRADLTNLLQAPHICSHLTLGNLQAIAANITPEDLRRFTIA